VTVHFELLPHYLNSHGVLHGGVTASLADEAAWHAIENYLGYGKEKVDHDGAEGQLSAPHRREKKVIARAYLVRAGQTLCVSRIDNLR